jgi:hypothetical protein
MIPGWKEEIEGEYLAFLREVKTATPADVVARLGMPECCAIYWLTDLAREGKVRILGFELVEQTEPSCVPQSGTTCQGGAFCPAVATAEASGRSA